jgi:hypothetical protein
MATIWPVYEGDRPTNWPWARLPLSEAITLFELRDSDFISDLETSPRFGVANRDLTLVEARVLQVTGEAEGCLRQAYPTGISVEVGAS